MHATFPLPLPENRDLAFRGVARRSAFEVSETVARRLLAGENPHGKSNREVIRPFFQAADILRTARHRWIIDFPPGMEEREAALYQLPFAQVRRRSQRTRGWRRRRWWIHGVFQEAMRIALAKRDRFIATPAVSRHRIFRWLPPDVLPDRGLIVFARDDDWFFGVLHSRFHQAWARRDIGLSDPVASFRYAPAPCFDPYPFPWPPSLPLGKLTRLQDDRRTTVAQAARALDTLRNDWLGDATDPRRTLALLYRAPPPWLQQAHADLDETVAAAYGWPADLTEDAVVSRLLDLHQERLSQG